MSEFDDLYGKYAAQVFRYALKCCGRRDVAEDITSEAFLTLYRNLPTIDVSRLPGWLYAVVKNRAIDHWRRIEVEERYLRSLGPAASTYEPALEFWLAETRALKPVHRACLVLRYVHGMTRAGIARELGLSENQVKGYLQYALRILRRELKKLAL